jgi:hypothetical protein
MKKRTVATVITMPGPPATEPETPSPVPPPEGLGAEGRDFWAALMREHNIQGVAKLELVLQRALAIDRLESIRTAIEKAGVASSDALLRAEIATRAQILRALGKLGLHQKPPSIPVGVRWRRR